MDTLREQMQFLLDQNLYDSAELLGCFLMSSINSSTDLSPTARAENLILYGDALYGKREHKRALSMYKQALQQCRVSPKHSSSSGSRNALQIGSRSSASPTNTPLINEHDVKFKIALCHLAVNDARSALSEMEGIPAKARTLRISLTQARLYRITGYERAAIAFYKECLRQCPYALEAIIALAEMGVTQKEMQPQAQSKSTRLTSDHLDQMRWLQRYADAQCAVACHDYKGGLEQLCQLGQRFPSNLHLTLEMAKVEVALGKTGDAMHNFEKARQMDQCNITGMDEYALLLRSKAGHSEMNRLVNDLLDIDAGRPEVWVASAVYWDMREDKERAAAYIDKDRQPIPTAHEIGKSSGQAEEALQVVVAVTLFKQLMENPRCMEFLESSSIAHQDQGSFDMPRGTFGIAGPEVFMPPVSVPMLQAPSMDQ
ncbi:hypothetical protein L7F22_043360 [Adiantum nelumboides]|nr:hypothetical protein [Adiantum nelumboides]